MSPRPWIVTPHKALQKHAPNLWSVDGALPKGNMNRIMAIVRLQDGRLVFHNAVPLEEPAMKALEAFGEPAFLVVPNGFHRLDIHAFKARYPGMKLLAPKASADKVAQVAAVDGSYDALPSDPGFKAHEVRGTKNGEAVFEVRADGEASLLFCDLVMNLPAKLPGLDGFVMGLIRSTGGPKVTPLAKLATVADKVKVKEDLAKLAEVPGLRRLIPSHGAIIETDAAAVLRKVAAEA